MRQPDVPGEPQVHVLPLRQLAPPHVQALEAQLAEGVPHVVRFVHVAAPPMHDSQVATTLSVHGAPLAAYTLAGQVLLAPVQNSSRSHALTGRRHDTPGLPGGNVHAPLESVQLSVVQGFTSLHVLNVPHVDGVVHRPQPATLPSLHVVVAGLAL